MNYLLMLVLAALIPLSTQGERNAAVEREVRDEVMEFNRTYAENDLDTYFSFYAEDATLMGGSSRMALADYRKMWNELIAGGGGVEKNEITDIQVRMMPGGEVAIVTYFGEFHIRSTEGEVSKETTSETDVWQKRDGAWKVVSLHYTSSPME